MEQAKVGLDVRLPTGETGKIVKLEDDGNTAICQIRGDLKREGLASDRAYSPDQLVDQDSLNVRTERISVSELEPQT